MYQITMCGVLALFLMLTMIACDAVGGLGGKPNTSAPNTDDINEVFAVCSERQDAIDDWENQEERRVEDDFVDGKTTLLRAGVEYERIEEEAREMRGELDDNCQDRIREIDSQ